MGSKDECYTSEGLDYGTVTKQLKKANELARAILGALDDKRVPDSKESFCCKSEEILNDLQVLCQRLDSILDDVGLL